MSDLVINTRQIANYPALNSSNGNEAVLVQQNGLGGPYASITTAALVATALNNGSLSIGNPLPAAPTPVPGQIFSDSLIMPVASSLLWNAYDSGFGPGTYWASGLAAAVTFTNTGWTFAVTPAGSAGQPLGPWSELLALSLAGSMSLPHGTLAVARDPSSALEVATMGWVGNNTVASFNARNGAVTLNSNDIYSALGLCSPIATEQWVTDAINAALQNLLMTCPFVNRWNGRTGSVYLMLSDISCVFMQPGQQPITQTPPPTSNDYSIANTAWVTNYVTETLAGSQGLATQAWVMANTVASFNDRIGAVTLALSDITGAGGAPLASPQLSGIPTAPTQPVGNASSAIATTAFVWNAVQESTTGVVSWNGRTGVVDLTGTDINDAGGALLSSPAFSGTPTAPTAPTGTTTTQLATCAFVLNEVQAIGAGVTSFNTRSGNVVLELTDITAAGGAPIADPAFSGNPTCPTPSNPVTATTSIANTAWVVQYAALSTVASFNGRIGAVTLNANDITAAGGLANPNVALTGAPTAPTVVPGTNNTQIATTAYVMAALSNLTGIIVSPTPPASPYTGQAWFNSTATVMQLNVWTGSAWTPSSNLSGYAALSGATFTGPVTLPAGSTVAGYLPLTGGTLSGGVTVGGNGIAYTGSVPGAGASFKLGNDSSANSSVVGVQYQVNGAAVPNGLWLVGSFGQPGTALGVIGINVNGALTAGFGYGEGNANFTWSTAPSDRRLKRGLVTPPPQDALGIVTEIPVYAAEYAPPHAPDYQEHWDFALVADEVQAKLPFAYMEPVDENSYASLHPLHLIATLWRAVQQLSAKVTALEAKAA